jgi:hypothetical protein
MHPFSPRKRRTRQHVIADMSVNHVERFIVEAGFTSQLFYRDYGYDLLMRTYDSHGYIEPGSVYFQLKAAEKLKRSGPCRVFDLDVCGYNLWMVETKPVILILYDASLRRAYWLDVQSWFREDPNRQPRKGAKYVRVKVSNRQIVNRQAILKMRELK